MAVIPADHGLWFQMPVHFIKGEPELKLRSENSNPKPILSIVVVSWNTRDLLRQCVQSALEVLVGISGEVIVVDNASTDGSAAMLREEFSHEPLVHLILNTENVGFAAGNNQALAAANGDIIAVVNPDIIITQMALSAMLTYLQKNEQVGIVSCNLVGHDGRSQSIHRALPTLPIVFFVYTRLGKGLDRLFLRRYYDRQYKLRDLPRQEIIPVGQVAGACFLIRRTTIQKIGGLFDERFPILGNDVDLCRRVWNAGFTIHLLSSVSVTHYGSASLKQVDRMKREFWRWNALKLFYDLHEPYWKRWILRLFVPYALKSVNKRANAKIQLLQTSIV